jgi:hypothetical protein
MVNKWIQKIDSKPCATHRKLHIRCDKKIPFSLLEKCKRAAVGSTFVNPTKTGLKKYKVTAGLKKSCVLALNKKRAGQKRKR